MAFASLPAPDTQLAVELTPLAGAWRGAIVALSLVKDVFQAWDLGQDRVHVARQDAQHAADHQGQGRQRL